MAHSFTQAEQDTLQLAIDWLVKSTATELPLDAQVSYQVAQVAVSSGFVDTDGTFLNQIRDNPYSTLLRFLLFVGTVT